MPAVKSVMLHMRSRLAALLCAVTIAACHSRQHARPVEGWYEGASGYERALDDQKASGRPVLVYFHTEWCGWCSKLERDVLSTSAFRDRYGSVLKVRVNPDENRPNAELASRYGVHGFPTVIVIAHGEARQPIVGYRPPDAYLATLQAAIGE